MPGPLEPAITVSKMERGFFQRGQKKLAKKRGKGGGSGKKKAKKAYDIDLVPAVRTWYPVTYIQ